MSAGNCLTTASVLHAFTEEIALQGGVVSDTFHDQDGQRLFVRSILPRAEEVAADDRLKGGVALKAYAGEISVHPYVFRLVCQNGAIMAQTVASRHLTAVFDWDPQQTITDLREAVRACCAPEIFTTSVGQIRLVRGSNADLALNLLPMLSRMGGAGTEVFKQIMSRFFEEQDRTQFGLMNAVTSTARDTADPQTRWNLEELGGGIPVAASRPIQQKPARSAARRHREALVS